MSNTSHLYALVPEEPGLRAVRFIVAEPVVGLALFRNYTGLLVWEWPGGLLCLEKCYFLQNPALSFSSGYALRTPIGIHRHLDKMYACNHCTLHRNTPMPYPVFRYFQFRIGVRLWKHLIWSLSLLSLLIFKMFYTTLSIWTQF